MKREGNDHESFEEESYGFGDINQGFCRPGLAFLALNNSNGAASPSGLAAPAKLWNGIKCWFGRLARLFLHMTIKR
ncbi:hypothetical protein [Nitratireductor arenosus]|uniref:hypothetical protein n=1 Tax=Nitratireductor arenosus TaxID=2682096 RepID=UPI001AEE1E7E|nr:hypothetical protein [Nitratireductor arenosus]